jgi:hypothetical protein
MGESKVFEQSSGSVGNYQPRQRSFDQVQRPTTVSHFTGVHFIHERKKQPEKNAGHLGEVRTFTEDEAKAFDITKLLGKPCMLNIIHKPGKADPSKVYEQIAGVTSVPKGFDVPAQVNPNRGTVLRQVRRGRFRWHLPDFIKDKMKRSVEYQAMKQPSTRHMIGEPEKIGADDDLPFYSNGQVPIIATYNHRSADRNGKATIDVAGLYL